MGTTHTNDYRDPLRTVGTVLIILGVLNIGWDAWRMAGRGWAVSSGAFAVIPGIILRRGSLKAARVVAFFAAFLLAVYVASLLLAAFTLRIPLDLGLIYLRLRPLAVAKGALWVLGPPILAAWVYRRLTAPAVLAAMDEQHMGYRRPWQKPAAGFVAGAVLTIVFVVIPVGNLFMSDAFMSNAITERAEIEARKRIGSGHEFLVSSWRKRHGPGGKTTVHATVTAYNPHEIQDVKVTWEE